MRKIIHLLLFMSACVLGAQPAQQSRAALAQEVNEYIRTVNEAAATFLNRSLPAAQRLKAIEPHRAIYDEKQIAEFRRVVADAEEPPEIRAAALDRVVDQVLDDQRLRGLVLQWLSEPRTPRPLRVAALRAEANVSFSDMTVPDVYQKLLDDPDPAIRVFGFTKLVAHGDARAQQRLIEGLENPEQAAISAETAIGILSMAVKKEFYPALFKFLSQTKDEGARLEAIHALGGYAEARKTLVAISRDPNEKEPFREAALGALYAGDRDNVVQYVTPILSSPEAPARLKALGIQMTMDVRQSMRYRFKARADAYDQLVERIAREAQDPELRSVAQKYVDTVRPKR